jgi:hypothetical protein
MPRESVYSIRFLKRALLLHDKDALPQGERVV